jgi:hypothetical protein
VGSPNFIVKTTTGGETSDGWSTYQTSPEQSKGLSKVQALSANEAYAVGYYGIILHTVDGGTTWSIEAAGRTTNMMRAVQFTSSANGFVLGNNGTLLKYGPVGAPVQTDVTTDGIVNIQACSATVAGTVSTSAAQGRGVVVGLGANPTVDDTVVTAEPTRTADSMTWQGSFTATVTGLLPDTAYHVRAFISTSDGVKYGADKSFTTASGPAFGWTDISANLPATARGYTSLPRMSFISDSEGWVAQSINGYLYHTTDGGQTFETITTLPKPAAGNGISAVAFRSSDEGYIAYHLGSVYYTTDGCKTWKKISNSYDNVQQISVVPGTTVLFTATT